MEKLLKQIAIVVDFSDHCIRVLNDIIPLANELQCDIHLLHIPSISLNPDNTAVASLRLMQLQSSFLPRLEKGRLLFCHCETGREEKVIRDYCIRSHIDLVILMYHHRISLNSLMYPVNINRLTTKTHCPVLNLPRPRTINNIRNIVLPVTDVLPLRKIMFATYLAKFNNARIHLVSLNDDTPDRGVNKHMLLLKAYQLLKDNTTLPVECHPLSGGNIADTTIEYAEKVNADLIVVEPGPEVALPGIINKFFSRLIFSASRIPVMAV